MSNQSHHMESLPSLSLVFELQNHTTDWSFVGATTFRIQNIQQEKKIYFTHQQQSRTYVYVGGALFFIFFMSGV